MANTIFQTLLSASVPFGTVQFASNSPALLHLPVKISLGPPAAGGPAAGGSSAAGINRNGPIQGNTLVLT